MSSDELMILCKTFLDLLWGLLNSSFFVAMAGAFGGAYGAHLIATRQRNRERLIDEIRITNSGIGIAFEILNTFLSLKEQHIQNLYSDWQNHKCQFDWANKQIKSGRISKNTEFHFPANFQTLLNPLVPSEKLSEILFKETSMPVKASITTNTLLRAIDGSKNSITKRNEIIDNFKMNHSGDQEKLKRLYLGLRDKDGNVDKSYEDYLRSAYEQTDDCIFFSQFLILCLIDHGKKLQKKYGKNAPVINTPDFGRAYKLGLMPDSKKYISWLSIFH